MVTARRQHGVLAQISKSANVSYFLAGVSAGSGRGRAQDRWVATLFEILCSCQMQLLTCPVYQGAASPACRPTRSFNRSRSHGDASTETDMQASIKSLLHGNAIGRGGGDSGRQEEAGGGSHDVRGRGKQPAARQGQSCSLLGILDGHPNGSAKGEACGARTGTMHSGVHAVSLLTRSNVHPKCPCAMQAQARRSASSLHASAILSSLNCPTWVGRGRAKRRSGRTVSPQRWRRGVCHHAPAPAAAPRGSKDVQLLQQPRRRCWCLGPLTQRWPGGRTAGGGPRRRIRTQPRHLNGLDTTTTTTGDTRW